MDWLESTGSESDYLSSDAEEFLRSYAATPAESPESTKHSFVDPRLLETDQAHLELPVSFQALNFNSYQNSEVAIPTDASGGAFRMTGRRDETLLASPGGSPASSTKSTVHDKRMRGDCENDRSTLTLPETIKPPSDESSLPSTVFSRIRTKPAHGAGWIAVTDETRWQKSVSVGHILDVLNTSKARDKPQARPKNVGKQPIRQVIVVKTTPKMTLVVPVRTYIGHGICGLSDGEMDAHTILYTAGLAPTPLPEEPPMCKRPLRAILVDQCLTIDPASRINFGKTKILDPHDSIKLVGSIETSDLPYLLTYWRHHLLTDTKPGQDLEAPGST